MGCSSVPSAPARASHGFTAPLGTPCSAGGCSGGGVCSPGPHTGCQGIAGAPCAPLSSLQGCFSASGSSWLHNSISAIPWICSSQLGELLHQSPLPSIPYLLQDILRVPGTVGGVSWQQSLPRCRSSAFGYTVTMGSDTSQPSVPSHYGSWLNVSPPTLHDCAGTGSAMAAVTAGTGSQSLRAGGSSQESHLPHHPQLHLRGFQSILPKVSP